MAVVAALTGVTLLLAAVYEQTPLKNICLSKCRSPLSLLLGSWRDGWSGPVRMGMRNGAWCVGCCWALIWRSITRRRRDDRSVPQGMDKRNAYDLRQEIGQPPLVVRIPVVGVRYVVCGGAGWGRGGRCRRW